MDLSIGTVILLAVVAVVGIGSFALVRQSRRLRASGTTPRDGSGDTSIGTPPTR